MAGSVFTTQFKQRNRIIAGLMLIVAATSPFVVGLVLINYPGPWLSSAVAAGITALAFLLAALLPWRVVEHLALLGNKVLRQQLIEKLGSTGESIDSGVHREFVGFSPGRELRSWDGETDRDVGFLVMDRGALIYCGDEYSWTLRREAIEAIEVAPRAAQPHRVVVIWHAPREPGRAFTLASREAQTLRGANRASAKLLRDLRQWHNEVSDAGGPTPVLGLPPTDISGSYPVEKPPAGSCATLLAVTIIVTLSIWYVAQQFISAGYYYHGILWAGLIAVAGAMFVVHFLGYLQSYEAKLGARW